MLQLLPGIGPVHAGQALGRMVEAAAPLDALVDAKPPAAQAWPDLVVLMAGLRRRGIRWPAEIEAVQRWYAPRLGRWHEDAETRMADLVQLVQSAAGSASRSDFLADLTLDPPEATGDLSGPPLHDDDYLILSTIHGAKGQERRSVHILNAVDGCIPSDLGAGTTEEIEEERTLLYVAMTRAKDDLHLVFRIASTPMGRRRPGPPCLRPADAVDSERAAPVFRGHDMVERDRGARCRRAHRPDARRCRREAPRDVELAGGTSRISEIGRSGMRFAFVLVLLAASPALAAVQVIDGDTIRVDGARIRMWGIDAPERRQTCRIGGVERRIGEEATEQLRSILAEGELRCRTRDTDRYGRDVAECWAGSRSVGEAMVRSGWAWALPRYSRDAYLPAQEEAERADRGVWAGRRTCEAPARFRQDQRR